VIPKAAPGVRAVDPRGLVHIAGDGAQSAQEDQHREGRAAPHVRDDDGEHRCLGEPVHRAETEQRQPFVQRSVIEVEHRDPQESGDERRIDPGQEHGRIHHVRRAEAAMLRVIDQQGEAEAEQELTDDRRPDDEDDRVDDDPREVGIAEQPHVVVETDETRVRRIEAHEGTVGEA